MQKLNDVIKSLDGKSVSSYTKLYGRYERNGIVYHIRNVYGGTYKFAQVSIEIPSCQLLKKQMQSLSDNIALSAFFMREFTLAARMANEKMQLSESSVQKGCFLVYKFGSRVLPNTAVQVNDNDITISMTIKLPYNSTAYNRGQRAVPELGIKGQSGSFLAMSDQAQKDSFNNRKKGIISEKAVRLLLIKNLPSLAESFISNIDENILKKNVELWRNQMYIRYYLNNNNYVSFIANGSILPRRGKTDYKNNRGAIPFISPKTMQITIPLPDGEMISGMAIPKGITVIIGDAYHGKSTILRAVKEGVYNHILGDGREYVITSESAMSIQAEDGRRIRNTDISFFLRALPEKTNCPHRFSTDSASGSTSQAAAVVEALESKCSLMLFDEDRSANNFMYKDGKMRSVIRTISTSPFVDNVRMFYDMYGVSSIIVAGASGESFGVADKILLVENFKVSALEDFRKDQRNYSYSYYVKKRTVNVEELSKICLAKNIEIKDDSTIKIGDDDIVVSDIIPYVTRGQLAFICSFIYYLIVIEGVKDGDLVKSVFLLYDKNVFKSLGLICQVGFRGTSDIIEYVRPEDILAIMYRLKTIDFSSS